jgi:hypothetical protein
VFDHHLLLPELDKLPSEAGVFGLFLRVNREVEPNESWGAVYIGHGNILEGVRKAIELPCVVSSCPLVDNLEVMYTLDSSKGRLDVHAVRTTLNPVCK